MIDNKIISFFAELYPKDKVYSSAINAVLLFLVSYNTYSTEMIGQRLDNFESAFSRFLYNQASVDSEQNSRLDKQSDDLEKQDDRLNKQEEKVDEQGNRIDNLEKKQKEQEEGFKKKKA